jgi:hypothetical protein
MTEEDTEVTAEAGADESTGGDESLSDMFGESEVEVKADTDDEKGETAEAETKEPEKEPEVAAEAEGEPPSPQEQGRLAALMAEREQKRVAKAEVAELKAKLAELTAPVEVPDPIEDPEGYSEHVRKQASGDSLKDKINNSRELMMTVDEDFERLETVFKDMVLDADGNVVDEGLLTKYQQSSNPAKFSMVEARKKERLELVNGPTYDDDLRKEGYAQALAEIKKEGERGLSATEVPDLTGATAVGSNSGKTVQQTTLTGMFEDS